MDSEDSSGVSSVRSDLLSEAGRESGVLDGQGRLGYPLFAVESSDRLLGGGDQVLLVQRLVVSLLTPLARHLKVTKITINGGKSIDPTNHLTKKKITLFFELGGNALKIRKC